MATDNMKEILVAVIGFGVVLVAAVKLIHGVFFSESMPRLNATGKGGLSGDNQYQLHLWKKDYPKDVVILFQIPRTPDAPNLSPYGIKLETYLRMAKIPYQIEYSLKLSPKHKTPWIMFNGQVISDSHFIIDFLNKKFDVDLSGHLTPREKALSRSMQKIAEDSIYWICNLYQWVNGYSDTYLWKGIPRSRLWRIKSLFTKFTFAQGYGRHTPEEVESLCIEDLQSLNDHIGRDGFLMGNLPCEADCAVFGILSMLWMLPDSSFVTKKVKDNVYPNLATYHEKMKKKFWPDYEERC